jgi:hypothetical protein
VQCNLVGPKSACLLCQHMSCKQFSADLAVFFCREHIMRAQSDSDPKHPGMSGCLTAAGCVRDCSRPGLSFLACMQLISCGGP